MRAERNKRAFRFHTRHNATAQLILRCTEDKYGRRSPLMCHVPNHDIVVPPAVLERKPTNDCQGCHFGPDNEK